MLNSEHSIAWNTAYSITYEDYAEIRTKLHDKKNPMQKSAENNIKRLRCVQFSMMLSGKKLCCFGEETAYWNDFMQFSEENSIPNEIRLFWRRNSTLE